MNIEDLVAKIKSIHATINGKHDDIVLIYSGGADGQANWKIRINATEACGISQIEAAASLLNKLKKELNHRIDITEKQVSEYKKVLNQSQQN